MTKRGIDEEIFITSVWENECSAEKIFNFSLKLCDYENEEKIMIEGLLKEQFINHYSTIYLVFYLTHFEVS